MGIDDVVGSLAKKGFVTSEHQNQPGVWDFGHKGSGQFRDLDGWFKFWESGYPHKVHIWVYPDRRAGYQLAEIFFKMGFETVTLDDEQPCTGGEW